MTLAKVAIGLIFTILMLDAASPASASDTRAERLQQQRLKKALGLKPPERSSLERFLYTFKEQRILERYQAGFKGFHPMLGGLSTGSGFALGTQFRKADLARGALAVQRFRTGITCGVSKVRNEC